MNKFFTKQESNTICDLLQSQDIENIRLGITLLEVHKYYKRMQKCIVTRYCKNLLRTRSYVSDIKPKYSLRDYIRMYNITWKEKDEISSTYINNLVEFIKTRTYEKEFKRLQ